MQWADRAVKTAAMIGKKDGNADDTDVHDETKSVSETRRNPRMSRASRGKFEIPSPGRLFTGVTGDSTVIRDEKIPGANLNLLGQSGLGV